MPYRKKYRKRKRRRRRRRRRSSNVMVSRQLICPDYAYSKLKTVYSIPKDPVNNEPEVVDFSMNDLENNLPSEIMNQTPVGYNEWGTFYGRYAVMATKIVLRLINLSNDPMVCTLIPMVFDENEENYLDLSANKGGRSRILNRQTSGIAHITMSLYRKTKSVAGQNYNDVDYSAQIDANPVKQCRYRLSVQRVAPEAATGQLQILAEITYYIKWSQKRVLNRE